MSNEDDARPVPDHEFVSQDEIAQAHDPNIGTGTPATAPWTSPSVPWLRREPLLATLIATNPPLLAGLLNELATNSPSTTTAAIIAAAIILLDALGLIARQAVTPTARPRLAADLPLTPANGPTPPDA